MSRTDRIKILCLFWLPCSLPTRLSSADGVNFEDLQHIKAALGTGQEKKEKGEEKGQAERSGDCWEVLVVQYVGAGFQGPCSTWTEVDLSESKGCWEAFLVQARRARKTCASQSESLASFFAGPQQL